MKFLIRKAKPEDAKGITEMVKYGLKTKNFCYINGIRPYTKKEIIKLKQ